MFCSLHAVQDYFFGKWDECGERPFLWPLTNFPDRQRYFLHSVQCCLSSCIEQFCWDIIRTCGFATCCLKDHTSNLRTKWWRLLLPVFMFSSIPYPSSIVIQWPSMVLKVTVTLAVWNLTNAHAFRHAAYSALSDHLIAFSREVDSVRVNNFTFWPVPTSL